MRNPFGRGVYYWPDEETISKIKRTGCHVVPKPSFKGLTVITKGNQLFQRAVSLTFTLSALFTRALI